MTTHLHGGDSPSLPPTSSRATRASSSDSSNWGLFGGVLLIVLGGLNVVQGITALTHDELLSDELIYANLDAWGWAFITWGVLQVLAGIASSLGTRWGASLGMTLATLGAVGWFFMIFAAPAAAIVGIVVSVAIIGSLSSAFTSPS